MVYNVDVCTVGPLRMFATGRSYTQIFFKVQYIIIQAILSQKWMKKFTVTDEKIFCDYKAFDCKNTSHYYFHYGPLGNTVHNDIQIHHK